MGSSYKGIKANISNALSANIFTIKELDVRENLNMSFALFITAIFERVYNL